VKVELSMVDYHKVLHSVREYPIHKIRRSSDGMTRFEVWTVDRRISWSKTGIHHIRISGKITPSAERNTVSIRVSPGVDAYLGFAVFLVALIYGLFWGNSVPFCLVGFAAIFFICGTAFFQCRNCLKCFLNKMGVKKQRLFP